MPPRKAAPAEPVRHLTTEDLAIRLRKTPVAIRIMHSRGDAPASFRCGRRRLYPLDAVEQWERERLARSA